MRVRSSGMRLTTAKEASPSRRRRSPEGSRVKAGGRGSTPPGEPQAPARLAHAVDPVHKAEVLRRLRRIEGQVQGLQRMVEGERYCADVLMQITSVQQALSGAGKVLLRNHLEHCITAAIRSGEPRAAKDAHDELIELVHRYTER